MKVGKSVFKAIEEWERDDPESAMLHACNAVDGTARKRFPSLGNRARFTKFFRDNYDVVGPMGAPGINLRDTMFPIKLTNAKTSGFGHDLADVIYAVHRCTHGHGDELPDGFELLPNAGGPARFSEMYIERGKLRLSDRIIFGLIAAAILASENVEQKVPDGCYLIYSDFAKFIINDWWGRREEFLEIVDRDNPPLVTFDFGNWYNQP